MELSRQYPAHLTYLQEEAPPEAGVVYTSEVGSMDARVDSAIVENYVRAPSCQHLPEAIPERASRALFHVLRLAVATEKAPFIIIALSTVQQMVAAGYIQGEAHSLVLEGEALGSNEAGVAARGMSREPEHLSVAAQVLHLVCSCEEYCNDDEIEVRIHAHSRAVSDLQLCFAMMHTSRPEPRTSEGMQALVR
jgi:hypothetical protein